MARKNECPEDTDPDAEHGGGRALTEDERKGENSDSSNAVKRGLANESRKSMFIIRLRLPDGGMKMDT